MDAIDLKILALLQTDATLSIAQIGLSSQAVSSPPSGGRRATARRHERRCAQRWHALTARQNRRRAWMRST
jgi:hypothetical protein